MSNEHTLQPHRLFGCTSYNTVSTFSVFHMLLICWSVFGFGTKEVLLKTNGILSCTHSLLVACVRRIRYYNKLCTAVIICKQTLLFRTPISHMTTRDKIRNAFISYCICSFSYSIFYLSPATRS